MDIYRRFATPVAALSLLGILGLYLKFEIMGPLWSLAARLYGNAGSNLSALERLGFYFDDLLLNFILLPLLGALLASLMPRYLRLLFFAAVTSTTALLYFFQLRAHAEIGQYVSLQLLAESFTFALNNPGIVGDYLSLASVIKLSFFLLLLFFLLMGEPFFSRQTRGLCLRLAAWHRGVILFLACGIPAAVFLLLPFAYRYSPEDNYLRKSAVERVLSALVGSDAGSPIEFDLTSAELLGEFRRQTATPLLDAADPRIGTEQGADILLFVLETTPAQVLDVVKNGKEYPGVGRLYERSFLGQEHYSTYPYTSDALYSVVSGLYPQGRRRLLAPDAVHSLPGLMSALDSQDYVRSVYAPDYYGAEMDDRMFRVFGADRTYYAAEDTSGAARAQATARANRLIAEWEELQPPFDPQLRQKIAEGLILDLQALAQLKEEIVMVKKAGRRFCSVFLPQIGHGPWLNVHGRAEVPARGRDLALLQDRWLAEILDLLAINGWLDSTLIVFTADHGIRTREEDPAFVIGKLSSYMFQVPLLIYAPQTLQQPVLLASPTSHVDIAPTVLALLGETRESESMQGVPVWQRSPQNRIFLFASQYAGADGFIQDNAYFMHHLLSNATFANDRLDFADTDMLSPQDEQSDVIRSSLRQATDTQISIVRRLLRESRSSPSTGE